MIDLIDLDLSNLFRYDCFDVSVLLFRVATKIAGHHGIEVPKVNNCCDASIVLIIGTRNSGAVVARDIDPNLVPRALIQNYLCRAVHLFSFRTDGLYVITKILTVVRPRSIVRENLKRKLIKDLRRAAKMIGVIVANDHVVNLGDS